MSYPLAPNSNRQRELLLECRRKTAGIVPASDIQPRTLRAFYKFVKNANSLEIPLGWQTSVIKTSESLLDDTRAFVGNLAAVGVAIVPIIGGVEKPGNMRMFSFPHPKIFDDGSTGSGGTSSFGSSFGGGAAGTATVSSELLSVRSFFNSLATIKVNTKDVIQNLPTNRFAIMQQYTPDFIPEGLNMIDLQTTMILSGGNTNKFIFNLGDADTSKIEGVLTTHRLYAVVQLEGYEVVSSNINIRDKAIAALRA
jgi:hypothetical protein